MDNLLNKKAELEKNGWVIIKNVFSQSEIQDLREKAILSEKQGIGEKDLFSNPNFTSLVLDERLINVITQLLGSKPVYFGDSSYQIASVAGKISSGFHKDNVEREDIKGHDWKSPYSIIRVGIYLQDHSKHSEGLILRTGSHKFTDLTKGEKVNAPTQPGDLVIWYLTTTHSGNAKRLKWFPNFVLGFDGTKSFKSMLYFRIQRYANFMIQKSEKDRIALFLTFGIDDHHLDHYLNYLKTRKYAIKMWKNSPYSPELLTKTAGHNITVLSMSEVVKDIDIDKVATNYSESQKK